MPTGQDSLTEIQAARRLLADRIAGIRDDFTALENSLRGGQLRSTVVAQGEKSPLRGIRRAADIASALPKPSESLGTAGLLSQYGQHGFRERSFDLVVPVTAPNVINDSGNSYDAGQFYDAWILNPSVDTKIDFTKAPNQNTPFITANSRMQFQLRAQKVWYLAQNAGNVGVMQIWLLKFQE